MPIWKEFHCLQPFWQECFILMDAIEKRATEGLCCCFMDMMTMHLSTSYKINMCADHI